MAGFFVYCRYAGILPPSATRDPVITSHHHRGCTVRDGPSALSHYTQSQSTVNRVYDSKARRYAEDNITKSNCMH